MEKSIAISRNPFIDALKGILILLVLLGHTIQYASGKDYLSSGAFYDNWAFKLIYGFHMPAFMLISGYLFHHSVVTKSMKNIVFGKCRTTLVPVFTFAFIVSTRIIHFSIRFAIIFRTQDILCGSCGHCFTVPWVCCWSIISQEIMCLSVLLWFYCPI